MKKVALTCAISAAMAVFDHVDRIDQAADTVSLHGTGSQRLAISSADKTRILSSTWNGDSTEFGVIHTIPGIATRAKMFGDGVSGDRVLVSNPLSDELYLFASDWRGYSQLQVLTSPDLTTVKDFSLKFDFDSKSHGRTIAVGCPGTSVTTKIFMYESDSAIKQYEFTQTLIAPTVPPHYGMGSESLRIYDDILAATVYIDDGASSFYGASIFTKEKNGKWTYQQRLRATGDIANVAVDDDTILAGVPSNEYVNVYQSNMPTHSCSSNCASSKDKPRPSKSNQWSLLQKLSPPAGATGTAFGSDTDIDGDTLTIGAAIGLSQVFVYKRGDKGMWSHQQSFSFADVNFFSATDLHGINLAATGTSNVDSQPTAETFSEDTKFGCLIVDLEDQFGDSWDRNYLKVDMPDGSYEKFTFLDPSCSETGIYSFRFCPSKVEGGLYQFYVPNALNRPFSWEIQWKVTEQSSGMVYRGNHATKMDFHFDPLSLNFTSRLIVRDVDANITGECKVCPKKPKSKPNPKARSLATITDAPTHAPTISSSDYGDWEYFTMDTISKEWFDGEHHGTNYYISNLAGTRLLSTGTMCDAESVKDNMCWQNLPDGDYVLRVGGALNQYSGDHTWTFCNAAGGAKEQLTFRVKCGECFPLYRIPLASTCVSSTSDLLIVLSGEIIVSDVGMAKSGGGDAIAFTDTEAKIVKDTLLLYVPNVQAEDITITKYYGSEDDVVVEFEILVSSVKNGVSVQNAGDQSDLITSIEETLTTASESLTFTTDMTFFMAKANSFLFASMSSATVANLEVSSSILSSGSDEVTSPDTWVLDEAFVPQTNTEVTSSDSSVSKMLMNAFVMVAGLVVLGLAYAAVRRTNQTNPDHEKLASSDVEAVAVETSSVSSSSPSRTPVTLDKSMMEGLAKMVQDEDAALANAMTIGRFN